MRLEQTLRLDVVLDRKSRLVDGLAEWTSYGVGRVVGIDAKKNGFSPGSLLLVKTWDSDNPEVVVSERDCLLVPDGLDADVAILAPPLALVLWIWEKLALELGEIAVYSEGTPFSALVGRVAWWRGGCPVIGIGTNQRQEFGAKVETLGLEDPEALISELKQRVKDKAGFAAVDLSGCPEVIDVLLEVLPPRGRLMLAGPKNRPLTIDFYNNIHRKGARLYATVFDPALIFDDPCEFSFPLQRAYRILQDGTRLRTLFAGGPW
ncbi:MAG: hypothetical protein HY695_10440 [Deltaproteobacteria bacterium]|nr:hypothetical protein [Deltaproteobacteria bacterium]